ncbi:MAG: CHRD domain-containing protein [Planctomycetes bacterium]|nr:CHRD domain-containing protein [Planctomycetota bacterium]
MKKPILVAALAAMVVLGTGQAFGTVRLFTASLDGLQEVPPVATPGTGSATATLDDVTGDVVLTSGSYTSLVAGTTAAHIHGPAPVGVNAGVLIPLSTTGGTSGTLSGSGTLSAANTANMIAGLMYVNVHTSFKPGGEIRGQLIEVPEPATLGLMGLCGLLVLRRRR